MIDLNKLQTFNTSITHAFHGKIIECDMREASLQISEKFQLLPKDFIERLKLLSKDKRVIQTGLYQKDHPEFTETLYSHLKEVRKHFIDTNHINENEILSIHSDAIIVNTKKRINYIIDGIEFRPKHKWTSYIRFHSIEIFYNEDDDTIVYKGISDHLLNNHTIGLCPHILKVFQMIENGDERLLEYMSDYQTKYLTRQLNPSCYIPFDKVNGREYLENLEILSYLCKIAIKES